MIGGDGLLYPIIGLASFVGFLYLSFGDLFWFNLRSQTTGMTSFVERNGTHFIIDGKPFYFNGWNSYWMMDHAVHSKHRINSVLQAGAKMGLTVCRTWAFNDGDYNPLQLAPGRFDEKVFRVYIINNFSC